MYLCLCVATILLQPHHGSKTSFFFCLLLLPTPFYCRNNSETFIHDAARRYVVVARRALGGLACPESQRRRRRPGFCCDRLYLRAITQMGVEGISAVSVLCHVNVKRLYRRYYTTVTDWNQLRGKRKGCNYTSLKFRGNEQGRLTKTCLNLFADLAHIAFSLNTNIHTWMARLILPQFRDH